jgi:hypothetical protein
MKPWTGLLPYRPPTLPPVPPIIVARDEIPPAQIRQFGHSVARLAKYGQTTQSMMPALE